MCVCLCFEPAVFYAFAKHTETGFEMKSQTTEPKRKRKKYITFIPEYSRRTSVTGLFIGIIFTLYCDCGSFPWKIHCFGHDNNSNDDDDDKIKRLLAKRIYFPSSLSPAFNQLCQIFRPMRRTIFYFCSLPVVTHTHTTVQINAEQITNNNWWRTIKLSPFYFKRHEIKTISITNSKKEFLISVHF